MSIRAKIAKLVEKKDALLIEIAKLEVEAASEVDTDAIVAGDVVSFNYGKGEKRTVQTGTVLGRKPAEGKSPALIRIAVGTGFDATLATVSPLAILSTHRCTLAAE
jgi:hypothetical protein